LELRHVWTSTELNHYLAFPHVAQCFCIQRDITKLVNGKQHTETVYRVASLTPDRADPERVWPLGNRKPPALGPGRHL
jgi:hypothetical protein